MSRITTHAPGTVSWVDLSTPDVDGAASFYSRLMGWDIARQDTPMGAYHVAKVAGADAAGMMAQPPQLQEQGVPPAWSVYIMVADLDGTIAAAEGLGASIVQPPMVIPDGARWALIADPTGAVLALFEGPADQGIEIWGEPGAVCWVELLTRDPVAAEAFYTALFGWKAETAGMGESPYTTFELDEQAVAGMMPMPAMVPAGAPSHWSVYFSVDDCRATAERAVELGGTVEVPVTELEIGPFAVLADPQGGYFSVFEAKEQ